MTSLARSLVYFSKDIKLSHSIFALPFAGAALFISEVKLPSLIQIVFLIVAMIGARSFAMGMNRVLDREIDRANPRTSNRAIVVGELSFAQFLFWSIGWGAVFVGASFSLSRLAGYCSILLLGILSFYSLLKRISWVTHWYLGACLGFAPIAVCIALQGWAPLSVWCLGGAVMFWTAGFDILYSLQDMKFDQENNLRSVPARFGPSHAIFISRVSFMLMILLLFAVGVLSDMGWVYYFGTAMIALLLSYEQYLVSDAKLNGSSKNIGAAFFTANAYVSVAFLAVTVLDRFVAGIW